MTSSSICFGKLALTVKVCGQTDRVLFVVFLFSGFRSLLSPLLCFITVFVITRVSMGCFDNEVEDPCTD